MSPEKSQSCYGSSKGFFTYGQMGHLDPKQRPRKTKPWCTVDSQQNVQTVQLIVPDDCFEAVQGQLRDMEPPRYYRVAMSLAQVLEAGFLTDYVKLGNVTMVSEGRDMLHNCFTVRNGNLTMYLDRETYEKAGLVGTTHGAKGDRNPRPRWIVEFDLKSPSMVHGKGGFDRLLYACNNALSFPVQWLVSWPEPTSSVPNNPLAKHNPVAHAATPRESPVVRVKCPDMDLAQDLATWEKDEASELATDMYEWLSLVRLESPRLDAGDDIDPYLSRYRVPRPNTLEQTCSLRTVTWRGFVQPAWVRQLLTDIVLRLPAKSWFSLNSTSISRTATGESSEVVFFRPPNSAGQYLLWEIKQTG